MPRPIITLLTDFGTADGYVAELKGVIYSIAGDVEIVDASHDVPPQDVELGRLTLARYWRRYPLGTVHLVVVDPGVGSARAAIAVQAEGQYVVGPDNGVLSPALLSSGARAVWLGVPNSASPTFHGRDVFGPVAARLAGGDPLDAVGTSFHDPVIRRTPDATRLPDGRIQGQVIAVDHFGNAVTNLIGHVGGSVELDVHRLEIVRTYADVPSGALCALVGSSGLVEISQRDGSAAVALRLSRGSTVHLRQAR
jgi:S-adenosylmethionine hydrolase